jgi:hypothetical protein
MNHHIHRESSTEYRVSIIEYQESSIEYQESSIEYQESSIENLTLAHFRHFSSLFINSPPLHLSRILYKSAHFIQNKPNFKDIQMNVSIFSQMAYEYKHNWTLGENKPNSNPIQTQSNPIAERVKLMQSLYLQRITEKKMILQSEKTNPIKPNFKSRETNKRDGKKHDVRNFFAAMARRKD